MPGMADRGWVAFAIMVALIVFCHLQQREGNDRTSRTDTVVMRSGGAVTTLQTKQNVRQDEYGADLKRYRLVPPSCAYDSGPFDDIYKKGTWLQGKRTLQKATAGDYYSYADPSRRGKLASLSGRGSDFGEPTVVSLKFLTDVIRDFNITSMIDVPCGDVNWQLEASETDALGIFVGLDVVRPVIELSQRRFAHHSNKLFAPWDFSQCPIPQFAHADETPQSFELLHVRDVIQHMPLSNGMHALHYVLTSGCKYLVTTTFPDGDAQDVPAGGYYRNNYEKPPFDRMFDKPIRCVASHPRIEKDLTCLYRCDKLKAAAGFRAWQAQKK